MCVEEQHGFFLGEGCCSSRFVFYLCLIDGFCGVCCLPCFFCVKGLCEIGGWLFCIGSLLFFWRRRDWVTACFMRILHQIKSIMSVVVWKVLAVLLLSQGSRNSLPNLISTLITQSAKSRSLGTTV